MTFKFGGLKDLCTHQITYFIYIYRLFREIEQIEDDVQECFDEIWGDFEFTDRQTFSRKKRQYVAKFNKRAESVSTPTHVKAMVLKSHQLLLEKLEVNIYLIT